MGAEEVAAGGESISWEEAVNRRLRNLEEGLDGLRKSIDGDRAALLRRLDGLEENQLDLGKRQDEAAAPAGGVDSAAPIGRTQAMVEALIAEVRSHRSHIDLSVTTILRTTEAARDYAENSGKVGLDVMTDLATLSGHVESIIAGLKLRAGRPAATKRAAGKRRGR